MILQCVAPLQCSHVPQNITAGLVPRKSSSSSETKFSVNPATSSSTTTRRGALSLSFISALTSFLAPSSSSSAISDFSELPNSGGVRALDLRLGSGELPSDGDEVAIHYYGRLAAKQGWRFDSTYDHKDGNGEPIPFVFVLGSGRVISGIEAAVRSMKVGGIRRAIIPPSQGYQNTSQEPLPPNVFTPYPVLLSVNCPETVLA